MRQKAIQKFNNLDLCEKSSLVSNYGKWVWYTDTQMFRISVFELEGELVEVWYNVVFSLIEKIRIPTYKELGIHLSGIKLPLLRTK